MNGLVTYAPDPEYVAARKRLSESAQRSTARLRGPSARGDQRIRSLNETEGHRPQIVTGGRATVCAGCGAPWTDALAKKTCGGGESRG